ncbi:D-alanyl-D-alanine carboxypeptidase family protein [Gudongella sp. DL1XJH-153]|uniref:D-alanyl-D-alanine carboxypeptidase family protein n=1 Tax=Gudongella sp. DL1XJH-153 TaxID=3409804 RepID=UPI003BB61E45
MKKIIILICLIMMFIPGTGVFAETLNINGESAILIDYDTGEILFQKNPHLKLYPASTTKMLTAILAVENSSLNELVTVDQEVVSLTKGSHIALEPGEVLTMEQLLHALLLPSANDAALAIAKHVGGSIESFVAMMNQKASELGALDSNFVNPNGLHDDRHISTAYDLALIGRYAMESETIRNIVHKVTYEIPPTNIKTETRYFKITNKLLFSNELIDKDGTLVPARYEDASGLKTGYTSQAMNCLVSYAERDDQRLIAVVLKADGNMVYSDSQKLLDFGFENYKNMFIANTNEFIDNISIIDGESPYVAGVLDRDIIYPVSEVNANMIEQKVIISENLSAPIDKGQILGQVDYLVDGKVIGGGNLISTADVKVDPLTVFPGKFVSKWYLFVFGAYFFMRVYILQKKKKRRRSSKNSRQAMYRMPYTPK